MNLQKEISQLSLYNNLPFLAKDIVEGFISGIHKSPFHGFSSEFSEHTIYNMGDSTRHIDWKRYAKTDKYYVKRYEEETNLRCHIIIDDSSSMHFPEVKNQTFNHFNKIGFSVLAAAALINLLKRQRDAVGISIYSNELKFHSPDKGSERHFQMLHMQLNSLLKEKNQKQTTKTHTYIHQIAEKIHRRSLIVIFTDMFQTEANEKELFEALRHLKYNKHEVILFHTFSKSEEYLLDYDNHPIALVDMETNERVDLFIADIQKKYRTEVEDYFKRIKLKCTQYNINYVSSDISRGIEPILNTCLLERHKCL